MLLLGHAMQQRFKTRDSEKWSTKQDIILIEYQHMLPSNLPNHFISYL